MIIALLNQKGGSGKTTLSLNAAGMLASAGCRVLLVDADVQGSALDWQAARQSESPFSIVGMPKPVLHRDLAQVAQGYDQVVIDGPPRVDDMARSAIAAADLVLIPVQPSPLDVWAARDIIRLIGEAVIHKPQLKAAFVINRKIANTTIGREVSQALKDYPWPTLSAAIAQRVGYAESIAAGLWIGEWPDSKTATLEIKKLVKEIMSYGKA